MVKTLPILRLNNPPMRTIRLGRPKVIRLGRKKKRRSLRTRRIRFRQRKQRRQAISFITSPKLTVGLAGTLATFLGGPIAGAKVAGITALGLGAAQVSPKFRAGIAGKVKDPLAGGRFVGGLIEGQPVVTPDKSFLDKLKEAFGKAGPVGVAAVLATAGIGIGAVGKSIIEKGKKGAAGFPGLPGIPGLPGSPGISAPPQQVTPNFDVIGEVKPKKEEKPIQVAPVSQPDIINRITVKPEINVRVSHSRKFINQQILLK